MHHRHRQLAVLTILLVAPAGVLGGFALPPGVADGADPSGPAATMAAASTAAATASAAAATLTSASSSTFDDATAPQKMIVIYKQSAVAAASVAQQRAAAGTVGALSAEDRETARLTALAALKSRVLGSIAAAAPPSAAAGSAGPRVAPLAVGDDPLSHLPLSVVKVSSATALRRLRAHSSVAAVVPNEVYQPLMAQSLPIIDQPAAEAAGYTGAGCAVAILDTGANYRSKDLGSCTGVGQPATCKVKFMQDFTTKAGLPYDDGALDGNNHGTNVASIASRVAPGADILALDVFFPTGAQLADILSAINWVTANAKARRICAMNLSLGGSSVFNSPCPNSAYSVALKAARDQGVLAASAAGNSGKAGALSAPACAPEAVSVGATHDAANGFCDGPMAPLDGVACFSNTANYLSLLAPGCYTTAGQDANGNSISMCGTSQASPHVAGAIAVLKAAVPSATPDQIVRALQETGKPITDYRNTTIVRPRISIKAAVERLKALAGSGGGSVTPPDTTAPSGNFTINAGAASTSDVRVQLAISADDDTGPAAVTTMCIKNDATVCPRSAFVPFAATRPWTLAAGASGPRTVSIWLRDTSGNTMAAPLTATIQYAPPADTTPPTGSIKINNGSVTATSLTATLTLNGSDDSGVPLSMCLSNSPTNCSAAGAVFTPLVPAQPWQLAAGPDGPRTVYLTLRDAAGNVMPAPASASVSLDTTPPSGAFVYLDGNATFASSRVVVWLGASDAARYCVDVAVPASARRTAAVAADPCRGVWKPYTPAQPQNAAFEVLNLTAPSGPRVIRAFFEDASGVRTPQPATAAVALDALAPLMGSLRLGLAASTPSSITLRLTGAAPTDAGGSRFAGYRLSFSMSGGVPPPGCVADGARIRAVALARDATTATVTGLPARTTVLFRLCAVDAVGNAAPGVVAFGTTS